MFDDFDYGTIIEHNMLKLSHGELVIDKGSKMCSLYILKGFVAFKVRAC